MEKTKMDIKTKNTIKRIAAISVGALMMGTTLMSAVAAAPYTLADFPAPFVAAGKGDFTIVVGQDAKPDDIIGAVDVGVGLQASSGGASGQAAGVISGETVKIEQPGDALNFGDTFEDVTPAGLDDSDLPTILASGKFKDSRGETDNEESYDQSIEFTAGDSPFLTYDANDDGDKILSDYVRVDNNGEIYHYTLEFDTDIEFVDDVADAADDMENTQIEIQGKPYIITKFDYDLATVNEIELLTGKTIVTLTQGDTYTFEGKTVVVTSVTEPDAPQQRCGISIDGVTKFIDEGTDEEFDGFRVGVSDVFAIHGAVGEDACELTLGSVLTKLVDGGEVQINGEDIGDRDGDPDVTTEVAIDSGVGVWGGFTITVFSDDELNLGSATDGKEWTDPVFENFKISYQGMSGNTETAAFEAGDDDGTFTFMNNEGKSVEMPVFSGDQDAAYFGTDLDGMMLIESDEDFEVGAGAVADCTVGELDDSFFDVTGDGVNWKSEDAALFVDDPVADISDLEGTLLFVQSAGQTARVLEISNIDVDQDEVDFKDLTYGGTKTESGDILLDGNMNGADITFDVSGVGPIILRFWDPDDDAAYQNCDGGTADAVQIELADGNLADGGADFNMDPALEAEADLNEWGYETDGGNLIFPLEDEYAGADGGDNAVAIGVLESNDIGAGIADRTYVETMMYYNDADPDEMLVDEPNEAVNLDAGGEDLADWYADFQDKSKTDDNNRYAATFAGSIWHVTEDADNNIKDVDATLAVGEARDGNAFVAETGALFTAATTGTATTTTTTAFTGAVARLDTEITDKTATNMILIGGPCVNRLTADALAQTYPACGTEVATALGVPLDGAQIALYNNAFNGTKVAMTVMGTDAAGTRAASEVLKRFAEFKAQLTGLKVNVKSTAGVITVSAPTVA